MERIEAASTHAPRLRSLAWRRTATWTGAAIAAAATAWVLVAPPSLFTAPRPAPPVSTVSPVERLVAEAARHMDAQAPFAAGADTTFVGASAEGSRLVYSMRIAADLSPAGLDAARARYQAQNVQELCGDPDTRRLIDLGGGFEHRYADSGGRTFRTLVGSCAGIAAPRDASLPMAM